MPEPYIEPEEISYRRPVIDQSANELGMPISPDFSNLLGEIVKRRDATLESLMHQWRGDNWDYGDKWIKGSDPMINEKGLHWLLNVIASATSIDKITTNITVDEAREMSKECRMAVIGKFFTSSEDFDVDPSDLDTIIEQVDEFVFMNLTSSRNSTFLGVLKPTYRHIQTIRNEPPKKGLFG